MTSFFLKNLKVLIGTFIFFGSLVFLGGEGDLKKDKCRENEKENYSYFCLFDLGLGLYVLTHATVLRYVHAFYPKLQIPTVC